jgi:serralysin
VKNRSGRGKPGFCAATAAPDGQPPQAAQSSRQIFTFAIFLTILGHLWESQFYTPKGYPVMASFTINAPTTAPQNLDDGETGYVGLSGSLQTVVPAITATAGAAVSLIVDGTVTSSDGPAVYWQDIASGSVIVGAVGVIDSPTVFGLYATYSGSFNVQNEGHVTGFYAGIFAVAQGLDANLSISNSGTIEARNGTAVQAQLGNNNNIITNTGTILNNTNDAAPAIYLFGGSDNNGNASIGTIVNEGSISATGGAAIFTIDVALSLRNTGTIVGDIVVLVQGDQEDANITNTGTLTGDIFFSDGNDRFDGRGGTLDGTVFGDRGNDTYIIDHSTTIGETLNGGIDTVISTMTHTDLAAFVENLSLRGTATSGTGNDLSNTITGNMRSNLIDGLDGNDSITGGAGNDTVIGGAGNDWLYGNTGRDLLQGGAGNDALYAGNGNDILMGDDGNDTLSGGAGRDRITGGLGQDFLFGGLGADRFIFGATADSPATTFDTIADFTRSADKIVLTGLDGDLTFIGAAAFTAVGQVRIVATGSDVMVEVNTVGTTGADMQILVSGVGTLTGADFIL